MTQRSKAELDALFASNTTGDITPARLRDLVDSACPSMGGVYFSVPGQVTTIATDNEWTKITADTLGGVENRFTHLGNNRLQYDGLVPVAGFAQAIVTARASVQNIVFALAIAKNGIPIVNSVGKIKIQEVSDIQLLSEVHGGTVLTHLTIDPGDYFELYVMNELSDDDFIVDGGHFQINAFMM